MVCLSIATIEEFKKSSIINKYKEISTNILKTGFF